VPEKPHGSVAWNVSAHVWLTSFAFRTASTVAKIDALASTNKSYKGPEQLLSCEVGSAGNLAGVITVGRIGKKYWANRHDRFGNGMEYFDPIHF
jgi:hypothetical protein